MDMKKIIGWTAVLGVGALALWGILKGKVAAATTTTATTTTAPAAARVDSGSTPRERIEAARAEQAARAAQTESIPYQGGAPGQMTPMGPQYY